MRRIVYAASFVEDADAIVRYIEKRFGQSRADIFIQDLDRFCRLVASQPRIGKHNHGYDTTLHGVVHGVNWIFFLHDADEVRFVHIFDARRHKYELHFG